jgi:LmbE family N-acetylglucosaminyl deacetylase
LAILGVGRRHIRFCGLVDREVPVETAPGFAAAVEGAAILLRQFRPRTLVIPSVEDQHGDHQAASVIWRQAARKMPTPLRVLDYIVWPAANDGGRRERSLALDIGEVLPLKRRAIAAHRSQHGLVVTDDPTGFAIPPDLLDRAFARYETFYEVNA